MMETTIKKTANYDFVETPCQCGCGISVRTKLQKYLNAEHYGKGLSKKNEVKRQAKLKDK